MLNYIFLFYRKQKTSIVLKVKVFFSVVKLNVNVEHFISQVNRSESKRSYIGAIGNKSTHNFVKELGKVL